MATNGLSLLVPSVVVVALVAATAASSRPAAGINVRAVPPVVRVADASDPGNPVRLSVIAGATFTPEALHHDVRVTFVPTAPRMCGAPALRGVDEGNNLHASALLRAFTAACKGDRLLVVARWHAYATEDNISATGDASSSVVFQVPKAEPAPRLDWQQKQRLTQAAAFGFSLSAAIAVLGATVVAPPLLIAAGALAVAAFAISAYSAYMSRDPVDPDFRAIAKPKTPPAPRVASGEGVPAAAAAAVNKLLSLQVKQIGLARAILTAFNRSQGAHVKKQGEWEKKQVRAAGTYAAQLSALMLAEAKLRPRVRRSFSERRVVTENQAHEFGDALVFDRRLPPQLSSGLTKLGVTKAEQEEIRGQLAAIDPSLYDGDAIAAIADPRYLSLLRKIAADLKAFSKRAAKDPLTTGQ